MQGLGERARSGCQREARTCLSHSALSVYSSSVMNVTSQPRPLVNKREFVHFAGVSCFRRKVAAELVRLKPGWLLPFTELGVY